MIATRVALSGVVLALLAGCTAETPAAPASSTSTSASLEPVAPLPGSTPPGTRLRFGDKAVITVGRADNPSRVGVIVTGVDKASDMDMTALRAAASGQLTRWAYLIRIVLVNEDGGGSYSGYSGPTLEGDLDGDDAGRLRLLNSNLYLPSCTDYSSPPGGWNTPGARFETCRVIFADPVRVHLSLGREGGIDWE